MSGLSRNGFVYLFPDWTGFSRRCNVIVEDRDRKMRAELKAQASRAARTLWGTAIYRWLLGIGFLISAFGEWPEAKAPIAFGYLMLNTLVANVLEYGQARAAAENAISDLAERKTRHAVQYAAMQISKGAPVDEWNFWSEVDRRVDEELARQNEGAEKPVGILAAIGLVGGSLVFRAAADLLGIGIAAAVAS